ncbi:MAG: 4-(cytidine 5'-diphospho)-2-C-methyl-D-erythritol kinase [Pseudomonadota bacterium]
MTVVETFVPAKVTLTLHVTGQRDDGFHTLDCLAMFADLGDRMTISMPGEYNLDIEGPMADGVPQGEANLVIRAAKLMRMKADFRLEKNIPNAAGLGGGPGDAAAVLRVLSGFGGKPVPGDGIELSSDVPICLQSEPARVTGIGDIVTPLHDLPSLHAVLVNPRLPVLTEDVFHRLTHKVNRPMPDQLPHFDGPADFARWLKDMRNDLQEPAIEKEPVIKQVFDTLERTPGCLLTRMSGSGGTCFGIYDDQETARSAAGRLAESHPHWWVTATVLNAPQYH